MNAFAGTRVETPRASTACAHCGALCADGARFCCAGCEGAHALIRGLGLDRFYARLEGHAPKPDPDAPRHLVEFHPADLLRRIHRRGLLQQAAEMPPDL